MRRNIKYMLILSFVACVVPFAWNNVFAWSYPLKQITITGCSWNYCNIDLPIITNAEYDTYKSNSLYRSVYSMQWLSTYYWWWDVWVGSHQGVDIACAIWTSVYSSYDWTVIVAWEKWKWGNVIVVQHEWNNQIYYTVYAHLSAIVVNVGDFVTEWMKIGEVWDTWNATWPHLHFQIDINQDNNHPFFPSWCGWTIDEIVNEWNCFQQVKSNTVDPIVFLEQISKIETNVDSVNSAELYLYANDIEISGFSWWFLETNSLTSFSLSKNISGWNLLLSPVTVIASSWYLTASPSSIQVLLWDRTVFLQSAEKTWFAIVSVKYWKKTLTRFPVLIWTDEDIENWRDNTKLMKAFRMLWINMQ